MYDSDDEHESNVLFLKGVYLSDCKDVNDIMGERLAEIIANGDHQQPTETHSWDRIPTQIDLSQPIPVNNLQCWVCDGTFTWRPVFIPDAIEPSGTKRGEYKPIKPIGNFCSFTCARRYINTELPSNIGWDKIELLKIFHNILSNSSNLLLDIPTGSPKYEMIQYGGTLTRAQWYAKNKAICQTSGIKYPDEVFNTVTVEDCANS